MQCSTLLSPHRALGPPCRALQRHRSAAGRAPARETRGVRVVVVAAGSDGADGHPASSSSPCRTTPCASSVHTQRRAITLALPLGVLAWAAPPARATDAPAQQQPLSTFEPMSPLQGKDYGKPRMRYSDFATTASGLQYKDLREGTGDAPAPGDLVVADWSMYTIGYNGRAVEARNKPKGGDFTGEDKDFLRFTLGNGSMIAGFEEAISTMKAGGIRRVIVPVELGYPEGNWRKLGPKPSTFAGDRSLDFVLSNRTGLIDRTLLFDIELVSVQRQRR